VREPGISTYHARVGGTRTSPIFCSDTHDVRHWHFSAETAADCLSSTKKGVDGEVYEMRDGAFTDRFWTVEARGGTLRVVRVRENSPYAGMGRYTL
jgi:hypothetical protein